MGWTPEGRQKARKTLVSKLGVRGYKEHMASIGAKGGKAEVPKGFSRTKAANANQLHERLQPSKRVKGQGYDVLTA